MDVGRRASRERFELMRNSEINCAEFAVRDGRRWRLLRVRRTKRPPTKNFGGRFSRPPVGSSLNYFFLLVFFAAFLAAFFLVAIVSILPFLKSRHTTSQLFECIESFKNEVKKKVRSHQEVHTSSSLSSKNFLVVLSSSRVRFTSIAPLTRVLR